MNIPRPTKALQVMSTAAAATGKASKSPTPAPVKVQHTKNATKIRRRKAMMRFTTTDRVYLDRELKPKNWLTRFEPEVQSK
jgi:hypothetical protein